VLSVMFSSRYHVIILGRYDICYRLLLSFYHAFSFPPFFLLQEIWTLE
jgi:hypothetical protein